MAFVNERVAEEEKISFVIPGYKEITPKSWTINKENSTILFHYHTNIDEPHEDYFAFVYNDIVNKIVLIKDFVDEYTVRWKPYYNLSLSYDAIDELRKALLVYGIRGNTFISTYKTRVIVDF